MGFRYLNIAQGGTNAVPFDRSDLDRERLDGQSGKIVPQPFDRDP